MLKNTSVWVQSVCVCVLFYRDVFRISVTMLLFWLCCMKDVERVFGKVSYRRVNYSGELSPYINCPVNVPT